MNTLLSQTVSEVLGQFCPGREAVVYAGSNVPADIVAVHERAHKGLTIASSFGRYLSVLALAMSDCEDLGRLGELTVLVEMGVEQCWVVQEGYATAMQGLYTRRQHSVERWQEDLARLPATYKAALAAFAQVEVSVREAASAGLFPGFDAHSEGVVADLTRAFLAAVSGAAMAVPVSRFFSAGPADLSGLNGWIRRHSPDGRLPLLTQQCTPMRVATLASGFWHAEIQAVQTGISQPRDDFLASTSALLCQAAGVDYEASDAVSGQRVLQAIGSALTVHEVDLRQVPDGSVAKFFNAPIRMAPHQEPIPSMLCWDDALSTLRHFRATYPGAITTVVCEVMRNGSDPAALGGLHLFVPSRFARQGQQHDESLAQSHRPARVLSVVFNAEVVLLASLVEQFPHRDWHWLVYEAMLAGNGDWLASSLNRDAATVYAVPTMDLYRDRRGEDWTYFAVPRTDAHPGWQVASPQDWTRPGLLIPDGSALALRVYKHGNITCRSVELIATSQFFRAAGELTYGDDCVAQVLAFGQYSIFLRLANES